MTSGLNGWQRLWELAKWLITIAVGVWCFTALIPTTVPAADAVPSVGQIVTVVLFVTGLASAATFGFLSALEWVYRGFRPLPTAPTEADQPPPLGVPEASPEPLLALGHQEIQQSPSASPTPLQEPARRE